MQPMSQIQMTESYNNIVKKIKSFMMFGQFTIFIIRVLSQRIFSVYIGIVLFQFILVTQMSFKTYCVIQSKFYLIMNCILFYLLVINFVQSEINQTDTIQYVLKDKYIINYVKVGYPIEFFFRVVATILMWRVYQYSIMKNTEYGDIDTQQLDSHTNQNNRIHVRQNTHNQDDIWPLDIPNNLSQNQRNLTNSERNTQYRMSNLGVLSRQASGRSQTERIQGNRVIRRSEVSSGDGHWQFHHEQQRENVNPFPLGRVQHEQQLQSQPTHSLAPQNINHVTFQFQSHPNSRFPINQQPS